MVKVLKVQRLKYSVFLFICSIYNQVSATKLNVLKTFSFVYFGYTLLSYVKKVRSF